MAAISAYDALKAPIAYITTYSKNLDSLLGSGIPIGSVTEFVAMAGLGKTQIMMQLCANTSIPKELNGVQGTAVYIDTEGSFVASRMAQIADSTARFLKETCNSTLSTQQILATIQIYRCFNIADLLASITNLEQTLTGTEVKLLCIDSIAYLFRSCIDMKERSRILQSISAKLKRMASKFNMAVSLSN